ncbi:MAG: hypothetical protein AB1Z65_04305 [Candidatus Sulfomarinibacteraceae bacterium]
MSDEHMSDKDMDAVLREWTQDAPAGQPDRSRVVGSVVSRLGSTRRRPRRWWLQRLLSRKPDEPAVVDKTQNQPSPIPATNGHTPITIGRTSSMFSPVKAITAGALVFAIGGAFLIAQPFQQQGSVPGAATDAGPAAPVEVTGVSVLVGCPDPGTTEDLGTFERIIGGTCLTEWTMSDERLSGTGTMVANEDNSTDGSGIGFGVHALTIENDEGSWRMRPNYWFGGPDTPDAFAFQYWVLDGEGAYEGLTAALIMEDLGNPHGYIFEYELPPPPENASTR